LSGDAFTKLVFTYSLLKDGIHSQLLRLLQKYAALFELEDGTVISSMKNADDIAKVLTVISLAINGENNYELIFALRDSDDDGLFAIRVHDGSISGEYIGD
jgi:thiamine monophosphate kinase